VPGLRTGRVPQTKVSVSLPNALLARIEEKIRRDGSATSVADYLRQAAVRDLEREGYGALDPGEGPHRLPREVKGRTADSDSLPIPRRGQGGPTADAGALRRTELRLSAQAAKVISSRHRQLSVLFCGPDGSMSDQGAMDTYWKFRRAGRSTGSPRSQLAVQIYRLDGGLDVTYRIGRLIRDSADEMGYLGTDV
jgi:Arc/MetJ-type ribon-helix-helix transcriptional regulator